MALSRSPRVAIIVLGLASNLALAFYAFTLHRASARLPNVLLVTVDCLRADCVVLDRTNRSVVRGAVATIMPFTRSLAVAGLSCPRAYAHCSITEEASRSLFTSRTIRRDLETRDLDAAPALQQVLAAKGYKTGAFLSWGAFLRPRHAERFTRGFSVFDSAPEQVRADDETTANAERWVRSVSGSAPWFAWVMLWDAHPRPGLRFTPQLYLQTLTRDDGLIERLVKTVDALGEADSTVVVATGIHGIELMPYERSSQMEEHRLRVPLVFCYPRKLAAGQQIASRVGHVDVMPTLLTLLGLPPVPSMMGRSLLEGPLAERPLYGETPDEARAIWEGPWKLVVYDKDARFWRPDGAPTVLHVAGSKALYNVEQDPDERDDEAALYPRRVARLEALMKPYEVPHVHVDDTPSPGLRKALQEHGYW